MFVVFPDHTHLLFLIPLRQDSVPHIRVGFTFSVAALNSAIFVRILQQLTDSRSRIIDRSMGTSFRPTLWKNDL